jgi:hypothetical protein
MASHARVNHRRQESATACGLRKLGLPLEIHEVDVQPFLRRGETLQYGGALPVEAHALHHHTDEESENDKIEATGAHEDPEPAVGHHCTSLVSGVARPAASPTVVRERLGDAGVGGVRVL